MKVLHITSHLGGGLGSVIIDFLKARPDHTLVSLDSINPHAVTQLLQNEIPCYDRCYPSVLKRNLIPEADIVLVHWYDHPLLEEVIPDPGLLPCRLIFWCHNNVRYDAKTKAFPDMWVNTSPIQGPEPYIWSTRNMQPFLDIQPEPHEGFNIGYIGTVDYKKMHPLIFEMCNRVKIPDVHFYFIGENTVTYCFQDKTFTFTGKVDDVKPYLAKMDLFGYPLRLDHYGTCEQVLGEAMCAGVPPVVLNNPAERIIVNSGWDGFIAPTIEMYIKAVENLAQQDQARNMLGRNARNAVNTYNHSRMLQEWDNVFNMIMKNPKRGRGNI